MSRNSRPVAVTVLPVGWMAAHQPQIAPTATRMTFVGQAEGDKSRSGGVGNAMADIASVEGDYAEEELRTAISPEDLRAILARTEVELTESSASVLLEKAEKVVSKAASFLVAEIRDRIQESSVADSADVTSENVVKNVNVGRYLVSMLRGESTRAESAQMSRSVAGSTSMDDMLDGLMGDADVGPTTVIRAAPGTGRTIFIREYNPLQKSAATSEKLEAGIASEAAEEDSAQSGPGWVVRRIPGWTGGKAVVNRPRGENIAVASHIRDRKIVGMSS